MLVAVLEDDDDEDDDDEDEDDDDNAFLSFRPRITSRTTTST